MTTMMTAQAQQIAQAIPVNAKRVLTTALAVQLAIDIIAVFVVFHWLLTGGISDTITTVTCFAGYLPEYGLELAVQICTR